MRRIICIGNRYVAQDSLGPLVYDLLRQETLPDGLDVYDGGIAGIDLLRTLEHTERVVFVDQLRGFAEPGALLELDAATVLEATGVPEHFDHHSGLPYLLACAPVVCESPPAEMIVVGVEGDNVDEATVRRTAKVAVRLAIEGLQCQEKPHEKIAS